MELVGNNITGAVNLKNTGMTSPGRLVDEVEGQSARKDSVSLNQKNDAAGILTPAQAEQLKRTSAVKQSSDETQPPKIACVMDGWIGKEFAVITIEQQGNETATNGLLGYDRFNLKETRMEDSSSLKGPIYFYTGGKKEVDLKAFGQMGKRSISGTVGKDQVNLQESLLEDGKIKITGKIGVDDVNLEYFKKDDYIRITGTLGSEGKGVKNVKLHGSMYPIDTKETISYLGVFPVMTLAR